ncbi:MAG: Flp family type IVb pilin [Pseudomonadota bacterium]
MGTWKKFLGCESGATAIEYGLIATLIALALIVAMTALGLAVSNSFDNVANAFPD